MKTRVLFLDDEQSLLNGIQRRLGFDYDLTCCTSGEEALKVMQELGPFAVVVTDMRMPQMDGVQFIRKARPLSPESVFVMLTGNQDQTTAIQAMNEGQCFRFLNKPCDHDALRRAIDSALRQHRLITSERELLQKTFTGAIDVLTEVLAMSQPAIYSQAANTEELLENSARALGCEDRWDYRLAAKLNLLGISFLSDRERAVLVNGAPTDSEVTELQQRASAISCRLIEKIPRLHTVAQIISTQWTVDGSIDLETIDSPDQHIRIGATLLRTSSLWNALIEFGESPESALALIQALMPDLSPRVIDILSNLKQSDAPGETVEMEIDDLCEGYVLAADVLAANGAKLLPAGRRLSWATIEKLRLEQSDCCRSRSLLVMASSVRLNQNYMAAGSTRSSPATLANELRVS